MFQQTHAVTLLTLAAFGIVAPATAEEPKATGGDEADHELDRHEAHLLPIRLIQDGQPGGREGPLR